MQYRMLALDLDGTLLAPDGSVSARVKAAVHQALRAGFHVCFATGRNWTESQGILQAVDHFAEAVFVGGAMVIDTRTGQTLRRTDMDPALAREVCRVFEELGHAALALQDTSAAGVDYLASSGIRLNEATRKWMEATTARVQTTEQLATHPHEHTIRVGIVAGPEEVNRVQDVLRERFGARILCQILYVPAYAVEVLEVFDPAVNKWDGVLHVAGMYDIPAEQIVAVGDDINDLPMIRNAGLGVAMGNAKPQVIQAARLVLRSNGEDGLAELLEELARGQAPAAAC